MHCKTSLATPFHVPSFSFALFLRSCRAADFFAFLNLSAAGLFAVASLLSCRYWFFFPCLEAIGVVGGVLRVTQVGAKLLGAGQAAVRLPACTKSPAPAPAELEVVGRCWLGISPCTMSAGATPPSVELKRLWSGRMPCAWSAAVVIAWLVIRSLISLRRGSSVVMPTAHNMSCLTHIQQTSGYPHP